MSIEKRFPMKGRWDRALRVQIPEGSIPWAMIEPHEAQAKANHCGQSLERLAQRGGLAHSEVLAVLQDKPFAEMPPMRALMRVSAMVQAWRAAAGRSEEFGVRNL